MLALLQAVPTTEGRADDTHASTASRASDKALVPEVADDIVAVHTALEMHCLVIRGDLDSAQIPQVEFDPVKASNTLR